MIPKDNENVFKPVRVLDSGATRSSLDGKFDYEGFFNPATLAVFADYLHRHRVQTDGSIRDSDNWQKGMDRDTCMKSALRHMMDTWAIHRGFEVYKEKLPSGGEKTHYILPSEAATPGTWERVYLYDCICGVIFNLNGYILEEVRSAGGAYAS